MCGVVTRNARCPACKAKNKRDRPSPSQRGYTAEWRHIVRMAIMQQPWCTKCKSPFDLTGDHIVPLSKGGQSTPENCQVLCRSCNGRKRDSLAF
ncbi:HNHc domain containing protein [uncultured Caudovirales phage]|uniref:HNHc domain containing protein n=1 Tax=uncultured Caudovirales phage TaxID=2100421 RepID=A0A6J5SZ13_9CAUD|nr:HNHc domain containing protein [uncultured Caudovirales phage]CAB4219657.1 HNHc domain containing protein [uncultured Caudovirales phage]